VSTGDLPVLNNDCRFLLRCSYCGLTFRSVIEHTAHTLQNHDSEAPSLPDSSTVTEILSSDDSSPATSNNVVSSDTQEANAARITATSGVASALAQSSTASAGIQTSPAISKPNMPHLVAVPPPPPAPAPPPVVAPTSGPQWISKDTPEVSPRVTKNVYLCQECPYWSATVPRSVLNYTQNEII
jgi:hypothetical protein